MAAEREPIPVPGGSDLARLLDDAAGEPIRLEKDGVTYRLAPETNEDIWARYDAQGVLDALEQTAGTWPDSAADAIIAAIYRARDEGSRPTVQPSSGSLHDENIVTVSGENVVVR